MSSPGAASLALTTRFPLHHRYHQPPHQPPSQYPPHPPLGARAGDANHEVRGTPPALETPANATLPLARRPRCFPAGSSTPSDAFFFYLIVHICFALNFTLSFLHEPFLFALLRLRFACHPDRPSVEADSRRCGPRARSGGGCTAHAHTRVFPLPHSDSHTHAPPHAHTHTHTHTARLSFSATPLLSMPRVLAARWIRWKITHLSP